MPQRSRRAVSAAAAVLALFGGGVIGCSRDGASADITAKAVTSTTAAPTVEGAWADESFLVADAVGPKVNLFSAPGTPATYLPQMDNPTWEGLSVVFLVLEDKGEWLNVRVSSRPNGLTAWIKRSEVKLRRVPNHVVVEVGARRITVYKGKQVLLQGKVAVGTDRTPTPTGEFFVDGVVDVPNDNGAYGAFQVSVSGFSNVLKSFGGGPGQIALHGTNRPELLGQNVSNGCVRMDNATVTKLVDLAPTGTPVSIVP